MPQEKAQGLAQEMLPPDRTRIEQQFHPGGYSAGEVTGKGVTGTGTP
ncbi:hypothetical protein ACIRPP_29940 [Streptomyces sp. NPDC101219]